MIPECAGLELLIIYSIITQNTAVDIGPDIGSSCYNFSFKLLNVSPSQTGPLLTMAGALGLAFIVTEI